MVGVVVMRVAGLEETALSEAALLLLEPVQRRSVGGFKVELIHDEAPARSQKVEGPLKRLPQG